MTCQTPVDFPQYCFDIIFTGSAVAIQVSAGPNAGIIEHSIVYFGLNGAPRTPEGVDMADVYFDGSKGYGPEE